VILGFVLLVLGFLLGIAILVTLGIILVVIGAIWQLVEVVVRRRRDRRSG
jgi:Zn-dependent membrane protease YugP